MLDQQSFLWLMEGLKIEQKTAILKGKPKDLFREKMLKYFEKPHMLLYFFNDIYKPDVQKRIAFVHWA